MVRATFACLLICLPVVAGAADEGRFLYLEQEVRNLQREVMTLKRRLDDATTRPERMAPPQDAAENPVVTSTDWVDADKWRKLRPGMTELEVISLLGPPTSMRENEGTRVLYYALEIGSSGFLGGNIKFRDRVVVAIQTPVLQ